MRVVDTDILIDHFHNVNAATEFVARALLQYGVLLISIVSVTEILAGLRAGEEERTEELFAFFSIVDVDEKIARLASNYLNQFEKSCACLTNEDEKRSCSSTNVDFSIAPSKV